MGNQFIAPNQALLPLSNGGVHHYQIYDIYNMWYDIIYDAY